MKYNIIYADPPWAYPESGSNPKVHGKHYEMMTLPEICSLPINSITTNNCALFLWVTMPRLLDGIKCMLTWGVTYKTVGFVWIKANKRCTDLTIFDPFMGAGSWTRSNTELCLLGFKGKLKRENAGVRQVIYSAVERHSKKPDMARDWIVNLCGISCARTFKRSILHALAADIKAQIKEESRIAANWLIHYRVRKREHDEKRQEILNGTRERDENVGGGRSSLPGRPVVESVACKLDEHDTNNTALWLQTVEDVKSIVGPKKRQLLELRQECRYYISPDGGRPGWIAPVQQRFGEITGWCPGRKLK